MKRPRSILGLGRGVVLVVLVGLFAAACGSSGPAAADGGDGGARVALTCAAYCAAIQAACLDGDQQYGDEATCEMACPAFPLGALGDSAGDTLGCRIHYAELAGGGVAAAAAHCRKAGPGGDGVCGDNCGGYCDLAMTFCTAANDAQIYDSRAACLTDCATHASDVKYTSGDPGRTDMGNEVACELYHGVQASLAPGEHCPGDLATTAFTCRE